jgi:hypothetical protein
MEKKPSNDESASNTKANIFYFIVIIKTVLHSFGQQHTPGGPTLLQ